MALLQDQEPITQMLQLWSDGDSTAGEQVLPQVYGELRRIARRYSYWPHRGQAPQASAIVHETYLVLSERGRFTWHNRAHFFGVAARLMKQIVIDRFRRSSAVKRGGGRRQVGLEEAAGLSSGKAPDLVELDDALSDLTRIDPRKAAIVELRFFAGLTSKEISNLLEISSATVTRELRRARVWLYLELCRGTRES